MFGRFFRRDREGERIADVLYGAIVAQARAPAFYSDLGVPDSVPGRFEMLVLHMALLSRRLRDAEERARKAGQGAFDLFCRDMDNSLRDMGVADLTVPKKMRKVGEAYFGRLTIYGGHIAAAERAALAGAIQRTVFGGESPSDSATALADYMIAAAERLDRQDDEAILSGRLDFPAPAFFALSGTRM